MAGFDKWVSGATSQTPVGKVARRALKSRLQCIVHYLPLAAHLADEDTEYIHAARVGTRRAAAAVKLFGGFVPKRPRKRMKETLRNIRASMGDARDLDVYIARFGNASDPAAGGLLKQLKRDRHDAQPTIIDCATPLLAGQSLRKQIAKLLDKTKKHAKKNGGEQPYGQWATAQLRIQWDDFLSHVPVSEPSSEQLHEFRIAAKRFRYSLELLGNGLPGSVREVVYPQVKQLQSQLGEIQDHAVAADKLHAWGNRSGEPAQVALLAQFEQDEREQYRGKSEAFIHWWRPDRIDELRDAVQSLWVAS